ncbi:Endo-1,4-beta-xylanase A [Thalassocella blandensis]|nr:Endo-1,4-beta-xylanase A [Thalassocella blandensis]
MFALFCRFCRLPVCSGITTHQKKPSFFVKILLGMGLLVMAVSSFAQRGAYQMPYSRYEADMAVLSAGASIKASENFDQSQTAAEASQQKYVELGSLNSAITFTVNTPGNGVTLRFTLPDSAQGTGEQGEVKIYVNNVLDQVVAISSYWSWQYYVDQEPQNEVAGTKPRMRFDEVHFALNTAVKAGDTIRIEKSADDSLPYGIDFIELESIQEPVAKPAGFIAITDFGAVANDGNSDLDAMYAALNAAGTAGTGVYLPPGRFEFDDKLVLNTSNIGIQGAGMWHTHIYFSNPAVFSGGIFARVTQVEIADFYMSTINNRRFASPGEYMVYKAFMGTYGDNSKIERVWAEHFEVGIWLGGYDAPYPVDVTENILISQVRLRNNYADGINLSQGTSHSIVEHSNIRNSGDDGLAMWTSNSPEVQEGVENILRYNTVEHVYRAGGVAIFGGRDHEVHNLLIRDCFGGAGMRFTTDFPGYSFNESGLMRFYDIDIENCGTSFDLWDRKRGAIEFFVPGGAHNMQFDNITVRNAQRHAVQLEGQFDNITFNNLQIDGAGLDAVSRDTMMDVYGGVGIMAQANAGTVSFNNVTISGYEDLAYLNRNANFQLVINESSVALQGIDIVDDALRLAHGGSRHLTVEFTPAQASNKNLNWSSSQSAIVSVSGSGAYGAEVIAHAVGEATITATSEDGAFTDSVIVRVLPGVTMELLADDASEDGGVARIKVSAENLLQPIHVAYALSGSASLADVEITPVLSESGSFLLSAESPEITFNVVALDDELHENLEQLNFSLNSPDTSAPYLLTAPNSVTLNIRDNELPVCNAPAIAITSEAPLIDDSVDAVWADAPLFAVDQLITGNPVNGFEASWRAMASNDYLYVLVQVKDAAMFADSGSQWWNDDNITLYLDGANDKGETYDANDFQLGFRWQDDVLHVGGNSSTNTQGIEFSLFNTTQGYSLEVAIPWSSIGVEMYPGMQLGFDVGIDLDDDGGDRDAQYGSIAMDDMAWQNPSTFGTVFLTQCGDSPINRSPIVFAGEDQILAAGTQSFMLEGSASDPDGDDIDLSWSQIEGSALTLSGVNSANLDLYGLMDGEHYVLRLTANDGKTSRSDDVRVSVAAVVTPTPTPTPTPAVSPTPTATPSVSPTPQPDTEGSSGGGGSMGAFWVLCLSALWWRCLKRQA